MYVTVSDVQWRAAVGHEELWNARSGCTLVSRNRSVPAGLTAHLDAGANSFEAPQPLTLVPAKSNVVPPAFRTPLQFR